MTPPSLFDAIPSAPNGWAEVHEQTDAGLTFHVLLVDEDDAGNAIRTVLPGSRVYASLKRGDA